MTDDDDDDNDQFGDEALSAPLREQIRDMIDRNTTPESIAAAMAHRFEYHIFHAGNVHRIGRAANEDIVGLIGEWCFENASKIIQTPEVPVHVFMDGKLWGAFTFKAMDARQMHFREVSIMFGMIEKAFIEEETRVFERVGVA